MADSKWFADQNDPLKKHIDNFDEKKKDSRLTKANWIQRLRIKNQLNKNLKHKLFIETTGMIEQKDPSKLITQANEIKDKKMLKEIKMQNALLKQQARTSYKETNAQINEERAKIIKKEGFWTVSHMDALEFQNNFQKAARAAGVTGLGYQISKLKSSLGNQISKVTSKPRRA